MKLRSGRITGKKSAVQKILATKKSVIKHNDMSICIRDGELIKAYNVIGYYDVKRDAIRYNGKEYYSPSAFASAIAGAPRNGWDTCYVRATFGYWITISGRRSHPDNAYNY
jgi:hypothetical protein